MNQIELKKLITTVLTEAFDACCEGWNFEEGEEDKLRAALFGPEIVQEIADLCQESGVLHAHVEKVAFPSGKDIQITGSGNVDIKASGNMTLKATQIDQN